MSTQAKVGAFFLAALVILGYLTFKAGDVGALLEKTFIIKARFQHARGLKEHDPVAVSGVRVGEVKDMKLDGGEVLVLLQIEKRPGVQVFPGAVARIVPAGLLGSKLVDITNGPKSERVLVDGDDIKTAPGIDVGVVLARVDEAAAAFRKMMDTGGKSNLSAIITNVAKVTADLALGKGTIGKLIVSDEIYKKADAIAANLRAASATAEKMLKDNETDVRKIVQNASEAAPEIKKTFSKANRLMDDLKGGKGLLARLLNDEEMANDAHATLKNVRTFTDGLKNKKGLVHKLLDDEQVANDFAQAVRSFRDAAGEIKRFVARVDQSKGTLQLLLSDPSLYQDAKRVLLEAEEAIRGFKEQIPVGTFTGLLLSAF